MRPVRMLGVTAVLVMIWAAPVRAEERAGSSDAPNLKEYSPEDKSFTVSYPKDWQKRPGEGANAVIFRENRDAPPGGRVQTIVVGKPQPVDADTKAKDLVDQILPALRQQMPDLKLIHSAAAPLGGKPGWEIVYEATLPNQPIARFVQRFAVIEAKVYILTFTYAPEEDPKAKRIVTAVSKSFKPGE